MFFTLPYKVNTFPGDCVLFPKMLCNHGKSTFVLLFIEAIETTLNELYEWNTHWPATNVQAIRRNVNSEEKFPKYSPAKLLWRKTFVSGKRKGRAARNSFQAQVNPKD